VVLVKPTKGSKPPKWSGGCGETHTRVREKMKKVLLAGRAYPYTTSDAAKLLESARDAARHAGLASRDIIPTGTSQCYWFPWAGTCIQRTLYAMCCLRGLSVAMNNCNDPCLSFDDPPEQVARTLRDLRRHDYDDNTLLDRVGKLERRKYDDYLSDELLRRSASHELLDVAGARDLLSGALLTCRHERETTRVNRRGDICS
jgi:ATP-dependent Lhr-like helicase